ncbi:MAG: 30S ribosomal protein S17 [Candidatus Gottesmanbacteria bacterium GW2011_GWB1_43_11]|uniref:30S ribosomal protein S17 n=1 Tax=Candidatus Gottesmanbacteria bacterium GW2011_GWB1_43_11 TaxID=1618446 RepID=A0A0G1CM63_9BACT|nr:MAG: 30S ribosomal protein S17 [Candidatus Gottesmanbacteria bacterium GW2011_GWA2_42_16]KKS55744.1 MAG: 30S ribosomal protein S17 [Candidatus Gottesmanbacteria bacterium GW2011_GWA1_42_26]KKS80497.1 MAG: 30S ribosomal protein S17 [Candidatus Gottesmanbacteria bacterium GW2011_GWC1_43_10]KKS86870.1 MAG: 30S ribosomal protein S17 [Candidatus Gottesmanbacteria bacterium GW2011_GWB1_43_11]OGG10478.1 MAG: 30S ribosomal protein S17 [Candidatus Gottesmanbacteria bacterium RIFCSPHIGHO2_01_FULL_43_1
MKTYLATVVANKMPKTVVVERVIKKTHPIYKKVLLREHRLKVHTEEPLNIGDVVEIAQTRPLSKDKHFRVVSKVSLEKKV